MAWGSVNNILSCDQDMWFLKLIELKQKLQEGIDIIYYDNPNPYKLD